MTTPYADVDGTLVGLAWLRASEAGDTEGLRLIEAQHDPRDVLRWVTCGFLAFVSTNLGEPGPMLDEALMVAATLEVT